MAFIKLLETYNREANANRAGSTHIELELRFSIRSLDEYKRLLLGVLADAEVSSVSHSVAMIKREKFDPRKANESTRTDPIINAPDKIATREYTEHSGKIIKGENVTFSTKQRIGMERVANEFVEYRLAVSAESPSKEFNYNLFSILRIKLRLSVVVLNFPNWRFDFTLVNEMEKLTPEFTKLRDTLFKPGLSGDNFISTAPFESAKHYEFEVEYIGKETPDVAELYRVIDFVRIAGGFNYSQGARYQEVIYEIAKLLYPPSKAANYRAKLGRKALGPSVVGLTREVYFKEILPKIVGMRVTIKLNGEGVIGKIVDGKIEAVGGSLIVATTANNSSGIAPIVYDSEYIGGKQHVFDVYVKDRRNLLETADLGTRDKEIAKVVSIMGPEIAVAKVHTLLTENYAQELKELWENRRDDLSADGLIFDNRLKWKPIEHMTIDCLTMCVSADENDYALFVGMNEKQSKIYRIRQLPNYNKIFRGRTFHDYFPIQFAPGDKPNAYQFKAPPGTPNLHGRICEYLYDVPSESWKFTRIREDRDAEVARGSYFGNNISVAISTWNSIHNPLTFEMLCGSSASVPESSTGYFGTTDKKYEPANIFSRYVKEQSIKQFSRLSWVIDLACGRGADIGRWARLGIKNAFCVDNDAEALKELMVRHQGNQRRMHHYKLVIHTFKANLNDPHVILLNAFRASNPAMPPGVPLIVCNMALHYMCESDASIWNFIMLIDQLLEVGGHFVFTCYNGARIFDLLQDKEQIDFRENSVVKYSIKRDYKPGVFKNYGQAIQPLLGCAGGIYVKEFLVNTDYWIRMFAKRGFKLVEQVRFDSLLSHYSIDNIENYDKLDDADHAHLGLYDYIILQKEKSVGAEPIETKSEEITSIISLPGTSAGIPVSAGEIKEVSYVISKSAIEQLPTKDIKASIVTKNAPDIASGKLKTIILLNRKWPGRPKQKKDGTFAKKIPMHEIISGDRLEVNDQFEVVVDEIAIVPTYKHLPDKFAINDLSTTSNTREEWIKEFEISEPDKIGFELLALRVRKL